MSGLAVLCTGGRTRPAARASPCSPRKEPPGAGRAAPRCLGEARALGTGGSSASKLGRLEAAHTPSWAQAQVRPQGGLAAARRQGHPLVLCCNTFSPSRLPTQRARPPRRPLRSPTFARLPSTGGSSGVSPPPPGPRPRPGFPGLRLSSTGQFPKPRPKCRPCPAEAFPVVSIQGLMGSGGRHKLPFLPEIHFPNVRQSKGFVFYVETWDISAASN